MSRVLEIWGASDDLLEIEGPFVGCGEYDVNGHTYMGHVRVKGPGVDLKVHVVYDGGWSFAVSPQLDDYRDWGDCQILERSWGKDKHYSETVKISVPDDTMVAWIPGGA